jgi:hypothetical protein
MAHHRKLIRAAIVSRLKSAATMAGDRVFPSRAKQLFEAELPAILVYTKEESAQVSIEAPREYERSLKVGIEILAQHPDEALLDDLIDDFCDQVERAMFSEETLGGLVTDTLLGETEMDLNTEGKKPIGIARISLTMPYRQYLPGDLTATLNPFERMNTTTQTPEGAEISGSDELPQ